MDVPLSNDTQLLQVLQASPSVLLFSQLIVLASMRAQVVFSNATRAVNKCMRQLIIIDGILQRGGDMRLPDPTVAKFCGLYFRAETMKVSIKWKEGLSFMLKTLRSLKGMDGLISLNGFRIYRVIIPFKLKTIQSDINTRQSIPFSPFFRKFTSSHQYGVSFEIFGPVEQVPVGRVPWF